MIIISSILILLFVIYASLLTYYRHSWKTIPESTTSINKQSKPDLFISVIVPARNEERNISALLHSLKKQTYPAEYFEIIFVDDYSTDKTAELVNGFGLSNLHLISLKDVLKNTAINSYKKKAIEEGVAASRGELIVTTDADCIVPEKWLEKISDTYIQTNASMLVMPVSIKYKKRFIEIFQALDFLTLQGITGAAVNKKVHSMCNGANLAYTRKVFDEVNGFANIDHIASGDDMLLMHKISGQKKKIVYLKSEEVIVATNAVGSVKEFFQQRIRWASKADKYQDKTLFPVLLIVYLFNASLLIAGIGGIFINIVWTKIVCFMILIKTLREFYFLYPVADFFKMKKLLWFFPLMQPFHIVYTVIAGWLGKFGSYRWKERNVH